MQLNRMKPALSTLFVFACGIALAGCDHTPTVDGRVEKRATEPKNELVSFFVYSNDMRAGESVSPSDLVLVQVPSEHAEAMGQDAIGEHAERPGAPADGIGFNLNVAVRKGDVFRSSHFVTASSRRNTTEGERQIALSVDAKKQPANLAPGDHIDLLGAIPTARSYEYMVVMENVEVAAVGSRRVDDASPRGARYGSITINVKAEQIKQLFAIMDRLPDNQFSIAMRAPGDHDDAEDGPSGEINPNVLEMLRVE